MSTIARTCLEKNFAFYVIGDVSSPSDFHLDGCMFFDINQQLGTEFRTARLAPDRHYARKNIGYLLAMRDKAEILVETDDDNFPLDTFWETRVLQHTSPTVSHTGWVNAYRYFSESTIWPRGLPLDAIDAQLPEWESLGSTSVDCPIQQGLANENPDVDAIYRLILPLPVSFRKDRRLVLDKKAWCPFNSQNTTWFPEAFPLLYLPSYCSFRMTDIWRSFIAQRIAWECEWRILFHEPTVYQRRNQHKLMRDFEEEIPGYLQNRRIASILEELPIRSGLEHIPDNLYVCYEELVRHGIFDKQELCLVEAWMSDIRGCKQSAVK